MHKGIDRRSLACHKINELASPLLPSMLAQKYEYAWVVDALDGTCAFEQRSPDFSVNIALLFKGSPLLGVVHVPFADATYW